MVKVVQLLDLSRKGYNQDAIYKDNWSCVINNVYHSTLLALVLRKVIAMRCIEFIYYEWIRKYKNKEWIKVIWSCIKKGSIEKIREWICYL